MWFHVSMTSILYNSVKKIRLLLGIILMFTNCNDLIAVNIKPSVSCRSYNILQGSPLVFKLVPAFSIIIFALWGVAPLIRQGRSLLFHVRALLEVGS